MSLVGAGGSQEEVNWVKAEETQEEVILVGEGGSQEEVILVGAERTQEVEEERMGLGEEGENLVGEEVESKEKTRLGAVEAESLGAAEVENLAVEEVESLVAAEVESLPGDFPWEREGESRSREEDEEVCGVEKALEEAEEEREEKEGTYTLEGMGAWGGDLVARVKEVSPEHAGVKAIRKQGEEAGGRLGEVGGGFRGRWGRR